MTLSIAIVFLLLLVVGTPIVIAIGMTTMLPGLTDPSFPGTVSFIVRNIVAGANSTALLALPLFIVSGNIMSKGGISDKLFDVFAYVLGKRTAGTPCAVVVTCLFYGAISGSGPATAAAVGGMSIPLLTALGYSPVFAAALVATAGGLGTVIPPQHSLYQLRRCYKYVYLGSIYRRSHSRHSDRSLSLCLLYLLLQEKW